MKTIRTLTLFVGMLCIHLSAFAAHWSCDASAYRYDMLVYVSLTVNGSAVSDFSEYEVAAFCGSDCRGVASFTTTSGYTYGTLRIRSNKANGEALSFKAYKTSIGKELVLTQTMDFASDTRQGLPSSPVSLTYNFVTHISVSPQTIVLLPAGTAQLSADITPSDANNKEVTWATDNASVVTVNPTGLVTAQGSGNATITCTAVDGSGKTGTAQVHVHTLKGVAAKAPTCTMEGNLAYWHCPDCGKYYSDATAVTETTLEAVTLPAIGHAYGGPAWNWSADGQTATATFTCTNDSEHIEVLEAAVKSAVKIPATCTEMGTTTYTAAVTFKDSTYTATKDVQDIPAIGHTYGDPVWNWSEDGQTATATFTCVEDDDTQILNAIVTSAVKIPATCTEQGTTTYTATVTLKDSTYTATKDVQDIPAIGHTYGDPVWNWSADGQSATATFTCAHDSEHTEVLEVTVKSALTTPPTCTEKGTTTYTATVTFKESTYTATKDIQDIPAIGHAYSGPAWNWSSDGQTAKATYTCSHDSKHIEVLEAVVTSALTTPPTCTEKGITTYTATVTFEGETYTATKDVQDIPAIGHTYGDPTWNWSEDCQTATATFTCIEDDDTQILNAIVTSAVKIPATCTEQGTTTYTATVTIKNSTYTATKDVQDIPAIGHSYGDPVWNWSENGQSATATFTCTNDSKHIEVLEAVVTSTVKAPATCTEMGATLYTATVTFEGETYTSTKDVQDIPAIGHAYSDPVWAWSDDGSTAKAFFSCENDATHIMALSATITSTVKTPATCTEQGTTLYTATVTFLEKTYTSTKDIQDIPATGHLYVYTDNGDGTHTVSCSLCDMEPYSEAHQCEEGVCIHCHACPVTALVLSADSTLMEQGDTITLVATITPLTATNQNLTWTSSDEAVATVADGIVTAVGEGTTTITVTACDGSGVSAACTVTVVFDLSLSPLVRPEDTPAYTLQGFRATPQTLGIIIQNGKKQLRR